MTQRQSGGTDRPAIAALLGRTWNLRIFRFIIVGIVNTAFSYAVYAALLFLGLPYPAASLCALIAGILFSFKTQGTIVFRNSHNRLFPRFVAAWALIYVANVFLIWSFVALGLDAYLAGALATVPTTALSYLTQRFVVFRPSDASPRSTPARPQHTPFSEGSP